MSYFCVCRFSSLFISNLLCVFAIIAHYDAAFITYICIKNTHSVNTFALSSVLAPLHLNPCWIYLFTCNSCSRDSPRLANKSQAKLATDGPGMWSSVLTASVACAPVNAPSAHLSIHLTRGKALRPDTLSACCSILLTKIMKRWPDASLSEVVAHFHFPDRRPYLYPATCSSNPRR